MGKKKTREEFEQELNIASPNTKLIGEYVNINTKTKFKCLIHDYEFNAYPQNVLRGHGCKKCGSEKLSKQRTKTHNQFVIDLGVVNPDIQVIGKYVDIKTKVRVRCIIDGYTWNASPRNLLRGRKCAVCTNHKVVSGINDIATTRPDLVKYFKNKYESQKYTSGSDKVVDVVCPECGFEDKIRIGNLSRFGFACNGCYESKHGRQRAPHGYWNKDTMSEYISVNYPGYKLLDVDKTITDSDKIYLKVLIKCPNESHPPYWAYWTNIISGYRCFLCSTEDSMSHGEKMAMQILDKHNIKYIPQKRYDDCRDVYTLPFDFYLPDYNLIIEIMGEQHEKPVSLFGGQEGFEKRIEHDRIKREYLKNNHIPILDIWYYEFDNMEDLIINKIKSLSTTQN